MVMSRPVRTFVLACHVLSAVGWTGALAAFLVLAAAGLYGQDPGTIRAVYVGARLITDFAIVPLALVTLATGFLQGLATPWGYLRHYWVLFKLAIAVTASLMLFLKTREIALIAEAAASPSFAAADFETLRFSLFGHAVGGLLVLVWSAGLGVYKPAGLTRYGWRRT